MIQERMLAVSDRPLVRDGNEQRARLVLVEAGQQLVHIDPLELWSFDHGERIGAPGVDTRRSR